MAGSPSSFFGGAVVFLRDRLGAPLEYDSSRRGYRYTDGTFELPGCRVSPEELLAVPVARRPLAPASTGLVADAFRSLTQKLRLCLGGSNLSEERLDARLSASWAGSSPCPPDTFRAVLMGDEANGAWTEQPEHAGILIGTRDMARAGRSCRAHIVVDDGVPSAMVGLAIGE